jgi:hypothetical protein
MFFNTLVGCIIFLLTNGSLLYTAHLLVRRFFPNATASARLVAIGTLFYSFIILIFQTLSPFYAITRTGVTITCLLLALGSHFLWGKHRDLEADIEPLTTWLRDGLSSRWAALIIICGFVVVLSLSRALLMPPLAWDCLSYHLPFATLWIKKGTLLLFNAPDQISENVHFPINGDIFASWLMLPFQTDIVVNIMNFPITLLGGISCYAIARELGLTRKEASFAPALICFAPMVYSQITTQYIDNAVFAFSSAATLFGLRFLRKGFPQDSILSLVAGGLVLGMKFTGIPVVGIIFLATVLKTIRLVNYSGFLKKLGLIICGLLILCALGGRQYILNGLYAGNPLYPFSLTIVNHEILEGSHKLEQVSKWVSNWEKEQGVDKLSFWEKEYKKFSYSRRTAGPKYLIFLIVALISLFIRPRGVSQKDWYFLAVLWIVGIVLFYANTSADFARRGVWMQGSTRFLSFPMAIFTIQGLTVIAKLGRYFKNIFFFMVILIAWDLMHINKTHIQGIEGLYPLVIVMSILVIIFFKRVLEMLYQKKGSSLTAKEVSRSGSRTNRQWVVGILFFVTLTGGIYFLQSYRDTTRYSYYRDYFDYVDFPRTFVDGWEFLDQPDVKKTIAMSIGWAAPGHKWFFYPLWGRWLQNDVVYISAKYKWDAPIWLHRGLLRGNSRSTWLHNLKRKKVDCILVAKPWPIELRWMLSDQDAFQLVFSDQECKIFKYLGETI